MSCIINIGTSFGNIQGIYFEKDFEQLHFSDIAPIVNSHAKVRGGRIEGWCDVTDDYELAKNGVSYVKKEAEKGNSD